MKMKRKTILVSIYYYEDEPITSYDDFDFDRDDSLFLNDSIAHALKAHNPTSEIFDVAIDETKPFFFSTNNRFAKYLFRLLRKRG